MRRVNSFVKNEVFVVIFLCYGQGLFSGEIVRDLLIFLLKTSSKLA